MHHVITAAFVASPLLAGRGGIAICFGLFTGEVTNGAVPVVVCSAAGACSAVFVQQLP